MRHPALIRAFPEHARWVLVRAFRREQGLMLAPGVDSDEPGVLLTRGLRVARPAAVDPVFAHVAHIDVLQRSTGLRAGHHAGENTSGLFRCIHTTEAQAQQHDEYGNLVHRDTE